MNELKVFQNSEFGELGVLTIDGKEYFPATQCATILGYKSPKDAIYAHCKGAVKHRLPTSGGTQEAKFIPEGDLYRLIIRSKLPSAEKFERWVFDEVLPELRKNGSYGSNINLEEIIAKTATTVVSEVMKNIIPAPVREQDERNFTWLKQKFNACYKVHIAEHSDKLKNSDKCSNKSDNIHLLANSRNKTVFSDKDIEELCRSYNLIRVPLDMLSEMILENLYTENKEPFALVPALWMWNYIY